MHGRGLTKVKIYSKMEQCSNRRLNRVSVRSDGISGDSNES